MLGKTKMLCGSRMTIVITFIAVAVSFVFTVIQAHHCGIHHQHKDLIVGGKPVLDPKRWPWIVALFHQENGNPEFKCGGSLVSKHLVITAAHCVRVYSLERGDYTLNGSDILLVMGRSRSQNWEQENGVQRRFVQNVVIHPSYLENKDHGTDVAFLELESPVQYTDTVNPVCLWNLKFDPYRTSSIGTVVGWGRDASNKTMTEIPRMIKLPIIDKEKCLASNTDFLHIANNNYTFCAGRRDGTGPCNGDSGSGMYVRRTKQDGSKSWVLRGLVSKSLQLEDDDSGLCDLTNYILFTDMANLLPWLKLSSCSIRHKNVFSALQLTRVGDKYYYFEQSREVTWYEAQRFCKSNGMELASLTTKEENDRVKGHLVQQITKDGGFNMWISGNDQEQEGFYKWTTGEIFTYTDWRRGQPNNLEFEGEDEDCILLNVWGKESHWWRDDPCSRQFQFICELELRCS